MRPLIRVGPGHWRSRDCRWDFYRHESDPYPKRWFAYFGDDEWPLNPGEGHTTLRAVVAWAARCEVTPGGRVLTDADFERLADEAEGGDFDRADLIMRARADLIMRAREG